MKKRNFAGAMPIVKHDDASRMVDSRVQWMHTGDCQGEWSATQILGTQVC